MVLMRAISRRTVRTRAVFSSWPLARWKRRLNCSFCSWARSLLSWSGVLARASSAFMISSLHAQPGHDLGLDGQLGGGQRAGLPRRLLRHAVDLEHDSAGMHARGPERRRALAAAHAHLGRLGRDRHVGEDPDPDTAEALQMPGDGAARRLD